MSPVAGALLIDKIWPIIAATVPHAVKPVGAEDHGELIQDTVTMAAQILQSCESRSRPIIPKSVAFYAIQLAKTGRRSYGSTRTDALCPAAQIDGNSTVASLDEVVPDHGEDGDTLHDMLAGPAEDPAQAAGRKLDWAGLMAGMGKRDLAVLEATVNGNQMDRLAAQLGISAPRVTQIKREIGRRIKDRWGADALPNVTRMPLWAGTIKAGREQSLCQHERAKAWAV